jgi:hypothetical protein
MSAIELLEVCSEFKTLLLKDMLKPFYYDKKFQNDTIREKSNIRPGHQKVFSGAEEEDFCGRFND